MSSNVSDLRDTIIPKSDQLNSEQLLGGPITITVTEVRRGSGEDQPVTIHYEGEGGRPFKPCKSMRKVLVFAWGSDGRDWVGRSMTIFNRPDVKFGGEEVGGIRISHLSHIKSDIVIALTSTRGRKEQTRIKKLDEGDTVAGSRARLDAAARGGMDNLRSTWSAIPKDHQRSIGGSKGCPDELKKIAADADAKGAAAAKPLADANNGMPDINAATVRAQLEAAETVDELNDAFDLVRELSADEQRDLVAVYEARRDALELDQQ